MKAVIKATAKPDELKDLAETLERWCDDQLDDGTCFCRIESKALADLQAGELPQPEYLRLRATLRDMAKAAEMLGLEGLELELEPHQGEQLKQELGPSGNARVVMIDIDYDVEFGYEDAIAMLRETVESDCVERIAVVELEGESDA